MPFRRLPLVGGEGGQEQTSVLPVLWSHTLCSPGCRPSVLPTRAFILTCGPDYEKQKPRFKCSAEPCEAAPFCGQCRLAGADFAVPGEYVMPELPEVETVARTLAPCLEGRSLVRIEVLNPGTWQGPIAAESLCERGPLPLAGTGRRGKLLLVCFEKGACLKQGGLPTCSEAPELPEEEAVPLGLAFHLKMSGRLFAYPAGSAPEKHTRLILHLDDGGMIFFDDARKFGYARALTPAVLRGWDFWNKLGPEPFRLDDRAFAARFRGRKSAVKSLLLDQSVIAGIGNIYADESCFRAGIRPDAPASSLSFARLARLRVALVEVLEESIEACGSSIKDYRTARGDAGAFQNAFRVYGRRGKNCLVCGSELRTCRVAGRTTTFCPTCQKG